MEIVDKYLKEDEKILSCIQIGLLCVQECADDRPTMTTVMLMLSSKMELPSPNQPAFIIHKGILRHVEPSLSSVGPYSVNRLSITTMINGR